MRAISLDQKSLTYTILDRTRERSRVIGIFVIIALALVLKLDEAPAPWWDEGWTLTEARTWVEHGVRGRLLGGEIVPAGLGASPPITALVAASFRLFGIGIWQARLVSVAQTLFSLFILYLIVRDLFDRKVAAAALLVAAFMSMHPQTNVIIMGRQVLAEPMMLLLLLAGYGCLLVALKKSAWSLLPAMFFWGIAPVAKPQALPFWAISLAVPLLVMLFKRQWRIAAILGVGLIGSFIAYQLSIEAMWILLGNRELAGTPVTGLIEVVALLPLWANRLLALETLTKFELPLVLGLAVFGWRFVSRWRRPTQDTANESVLLVLYVLSASWVAWYLLFANATIPRYLYPPTLVGSLFVAAFFNDWSNGFDLSGTLARAASVPKRLQLGLAQMRALGAIILVAISVPFTLLILGWFYTREANTSVQELAKYIASNTPRDAVVETYDSELFFVLDRRYHYPPDQTHVDLIRRTFDPVVSISYNALEVNPDYLVVGPFSAGWRLYDDLLKKGAFRLIKSIGDYNLYERIR